MPKSSHATQKTQEDHYVGLFDNRSPSIIAYKKAVLITRFKDVAPNGRLIEMVVWRLPEPAPPCAHPFKYRLVYVVEGERVIGFDNERGKGDHSHIDGEERPYAFAGIDRLIEDFIAEVERWNSAH